MSWAAGAGCRGGAWVGSRAVGFEAGGLNVEGDTASWAAGDEGRGSWGENGGEVAGAGRWERGGQRLAFVHVHDFTSALVLAPAFALAHALPLTHVLVPAHAFALAHALPLTHVLVPALALNLPVRGW
ncbi:hypothetical protein IAG44_24670 [Streptomyces roseirectus]|uniref:Uncharacterized protein n=1 Tax=Streptomyces roseirectus TaxID=2768066 RepID=A0A7H0IHN0_9ACTN|nr:hypothetical protein [Streptomyces roseirectus]QNP72296.1 hypothetical protein IAG44_24670 [Streptomyces roseirectus]